MVTKKMMGAWMVRKRERERESKRKGENEVSAITKQNLQYTDEYEM